MSDQAGSSAGGDELANLAISFEDCTPEICPYDQSFYPYRIDLVPNAVFLALFGVSLLGFLAVFAFTRRGGVFTIAMVLGLICEILGYAGRIMSWQDQWSENGFLMQICCLTIAPAFLAAGIYLCIRRIVFAFGPENSRIPPEYYTRIFIPCDVISLVLQAGGGGLASSAFHTGGSPDTGDHIMIAGLAFQVFMLLVFMLLSLDFLANTLRRRRALGSAATALDQDPSLAAMRRSRLFKAFPAALALSTVCVFWRSVYRVAELSGGWTGSLMARQDLFVGFEGVMITVAALVLNIFHPSLCFGEVMDRTFDASNGDSRKKARRNDFEMLPEAKPSTATSVTDARGTSPNTSDVEREV
ncbi:RTA1-domain-containing protein [Daldinia caldariorum]|uniref:RTA1-domain-containing protein n=1 Tax=Daldinia caldariorum TaxID=326644 RepID=UPI002008867D|nr:RTA1-domain-containing protein [Daldinia caldariorum]KAI1472351.1 RTA1-domain-containing protein [Daldinia caldariorum]